MSSRVYSGGSLSCWGGGRGASSFFSGAPTSFVHSAMYQIVNTRLITGKKTVISTNLSPDELGRRYGAPVLSRLQGEYQMLLFFGEDIRRQKRK